MVSVYKITDKLMDDSEVFDVQVIDHSTRTNLTFYCETEDQADKFIEALETVGAKLVK